MARLVYDWTGKEMGNLSKRPTTLKIIMITRKCLKCQKLFGSKGNRLCFSCNNENARVISQAIPRRVSRKPAGNRDKNQ